MGVLVEFNGEARFGVVKSVVESDDTYYRAELDDNWNTNLFEWFMVKGLEKKLKLSA